MDSLAIIGYSGQYLPTEYGNKPKNLKQMINNLHKEVLEVGLIVLI
jgi:pullulanase/glycogen debranching enzyme